MRRTRHGTSLNHQSPTQVARGVGFRVGVVCPKADRARIAPPLGRVLRRWAPQQLIAYWRDAVTRISTRRLR